ncbi:MAG: putative transposase [Pseudomonadota bacterium]|nr:putative transposase [Pseudomonadota bacterium]
MQTGKRRRLGERGWREVLRRFDAQSATVGDFCRCEGVSQSSFQRWRSRLAARPSGDVADVSRKKLCEPLQVGAGGFVDLGALAPGGVSSATRLDVKLDLGGGLTLHLVRG